MNKIKLIPGFPALLLLLALPFCFLIRMHTVDLVVHDTYFVLAYGWLFLRLSIAMTISWLFHVCLRVNFPDRIPGFVSWIHVLLSLGCWGIMLYAFYKQHFLFSHPAMPGKQNILDIINGPDWNNIGIFSLLSLVFLQVLFWIIASYRWWKWGRAARRRGA